MLLDKLIKKFFYKKGYYINRIGYYNFFQQLLETFLNKNHEMFFIQIGANDGKSFDPIYDFVTNNSSKVRGILIEPVANYFEELKKNYKGYSNVVLLNMAVHNSNKDMLLYMADPQLVAQGKLPEYAKGIASFDMNHHELSGIPKEAIITQKVQCASLDSIVNEHKVTAVDLLQIDTEGYDFEIILNLDFKIIKPKIIHFEHYLTAETINGEQFMVLTDLLHRNGYELWIDKYDATAYQRDIFIA